MKLDSDKTFGELYSSAEALQTALTDLETRYKKTVSDTRIPLRFLTLRDKPQSEPLGNTIHLRLTQKVDYDPSWAYVAVSYTWAQPEGLAAQFNTPEIKIWINDTEARPPYCPPSVIYRALQYDTLEAKTGHIWIDQECIDQCDATDRDEHIAHMHKIYERSKCTAIVLSHAMSSSHATLLQRCVDADESDRLEGALKKGDSKDEDQEGHNQEEDEKASAARIALRTASQFKYQPEKSNNLESLLMKEDQEEGPIDPVLCTLFERMVEDTYFTRAWTYQEQICSKNACYLIPILLDSTSYGDTSGQEQRSILMPSTFIQGVDRWSSRAFRLDGGYRENYTESTIRLKSLVSMNFRNWENFPEGGASMTVTGDRNIILWSTISGMKKRDCKYVSDRVTIIANISGLTTTLRTTELQEDNEASYSTCVLALLVMNQVYKGSVSRIMGQTIGNVLIVF